jgi:hypothetical protein
MRLRKLRRPILIFFEILLKSTEVFATAADLGHQ